MCTPRDDFHARCEFYGFKCRQKLHRTQLSHNLALHYLDEVGDRGVGAQFAPLLQEALKPQDRELPRLHEKLVKIIVESHFLTLKVNFEYFLNRMLYCLWSWQFEQLARRSPTKLSLRDVVQALSDDGARERLVDSLIPAHGLERLKDSFKEATDKSLPVELDTRTAGLWNQIDTAFEVRHLVEHCNGRVNQKFINKVQWRQSSWRDFAVSDQAQIEVRRKDFEETCAAMVGAAKIITDLTSGFWAE
jgi:hypothetical protein